MTALMPNPSRPGWVSKAWYFSCQGASDLPPMLAVAAVTALLGFGLGIVPDAIIGGDTWFWEIAGAITLPALLLVSVIFSTVTVCYAEHKWPPLRFKSESVMYKWRDLQDFPTDLREELMPAYLAYEKASGTPAENEAQKIWNETRFLVQQRADELKTVQSTGALEAARATLEHLRAAQKELDRRVHRD